VLVAILKERQTNFVTQPQIDFSAAKSQPDGWLFAAEKSFREVSEGRNPPTLIPAPATCDRQPDLFFNRLPPSKANWKNCFLYVFFPVDESDKIRYNFKAVFAKNVLYTDFCVILFFCFPFAAGFA